MSLLIYLLISKVPKPAVINKMKQSGVDASIIMKYELSGKLPDPPSGGSTGAPAPIPSAGAPKPAGLTPDEQAQCAKYSRMKKMNIPEQAIRNKMKQVCFRWHGVRESDMFFRIP